MVVRRRILQFAILSLAAALLLGGCILGKRTTRDPDRGRKFESPLPALQTGTLGYPQIREVLEQRSAPVKSVKANLDLVASAGLAGMQRFQTMMFVRIPDFMRVRGAQDAGTVFDLLMSGDEVQVVNYPERSYYRGTLMQLQANPNVLGGIDPADLIQNFAVEQAVLSRMQKMPQPGFQQTADHYTLQFDYENGMSERYHLRSQDLLVDLYERLYNGKIYSAIKYWGYGVTEGGALIPNQLTVYLSRTNSQFSVHVNDAKLNESPAPALMRLPVPEGFERMALGV